MKDNIFKLVLTFAITLLISLGFWFAFNQVMAFKVAELQYKKDYFDWQKVTYQKDLIKVCQQLSATVTNPKWQYKNCTSALNGNEPVFQD